MDGDLKMLRDGTSTSSFIGTSCKSPISHPIRSNGELKGRAGTAELEGKELDFSCAASFNDNFGNFVCTIELLLYNAELS